MVTSLASVQKKKYPVSTTLKLVDETGRATSEFQRLLRAISELVEAVTIEDGEVTANMISVENLEAISAVLGNVIINGDLVVEGTITTGKVAGNAITDVTTAAQVGTGRYDDPYLVETVVPIDSTGNTGVLVSFTAFMERPTVGGANFGFWHVELHRNGVEIDRTPGLFYDDNFAYPVVCSFVDTAPGDDPLYSIVPIGDSGPCDFDIKGGLLVCSLLKR